MMTDPQLGQIQQYPGSQVLISQREEAQSPLAKLHRIRLADIGHPASLHNPALEPGGPNGRNGPVTSHGLFDNEHTSHPAALGIPVIGAEEGVFAGLVVADDSLVALELIEVPEHILGGPCVIGID